MLHQRGLNSGTLKFSLLLLMLEVLLYCVKDTMNELSTSQMFLSSVKADAPFRIEKSSRRKAFAPNSLEDTSI